MYFLVPKADGMFAILLCQISALGTWHEKSVFFLNKNVSLHSCHVSTVYDYIWYHLISHLINHLSVIFSIQSLIKPCMSRCQVAVHRRVFWSSRMVIWLSLRHRCGSPCSCRILSTQLAASRVRALHFDFFDFRRVTMCIQMSAWESQSMRTCRSHKNYAVWTVEGIISNTKHGVFVFVPVCVCPSLNFSGACDVFSIIETGKSGTRSHGFASPRGLHHGSRT